MWHGAHPFPIFPFVFMGFIMVMVIVRLVMFRRWRRMGMVGCGGCSGYTDGRVEAEALLRKRLVNGEITEEEYLKLKEILSK